MTVTALVTGRLMADPDVRTGENGRPYTLAKIAAHGDDGRDVIVNVIAYASAGQQLAALAQGDSVAATGRAKVAAWTDEDGAIKAGLRLTAHQVLTAYHVRRRRKAMGPATGRGAELDADGADHGPDQ